MSISRLETRRPYDKFKKAIYDAEDSIPSGNGRRFKTLTEALTWILTIHSVDPLFRGVPYIAVKRAHGNAKASWADFDEHSVTLVEEGMCEQVILHEIAHLVTDPSLPYHGPDFCWNYLDLTLRWRGPAVYLELRDAIRQTGVFG